MNGHECLSQHHFSDVQVPGLNAPIPPGTQFGYQAGGWGKPPVNEEGEPLYGDVFGQFADEEDDEQVGITSSLPNPRPPQTATLIV